ncbi:MAG: mechanosensitive ion channel family protein [Nanoarchaeota archaeon]|nr:mechanosensitive ion channel family protein [Nanoarchaeota archaeon]
MIPQLEQYITNEYFRALIVFIVLFFVLRTAVWIIQKVTLKLASKTKTDLDDELVHRSSMPLTIFAFLFSLLITLGEITFTEAITNIFKNIIYTALVIVFAYLIYVIVDVILIKTLKKVTSKTKSSIDDSLISLFRSVMDIALVTISLLYILSLWGFEIGPLLAGLGIAGLAVALALQPILSNVFSGAAMILDGTVRVGDLVYLDEKTKGNIIKIGLRSTRIQTFDNELIIVPNNKLADSTIQNIAQPEPKSRAVVPFGVAYGSDIEKVKKLIAQEIKKIPHVEKTPVPVVRFISMGASSLDFKVYYYVDSFENRFASIDEANTRIYNILNKAGIEIPFPQMDVHIQK